MKKLILMFFLLNTIFLVSAQTWVKEKHKDGIVIYTKASTKYGMKASRAEMYLQVPVEKVVAALLNINDYTTWMPDCAEAKVLKQISKDELIYYALFTSPWPAADRDVVLHVKKVAIPNGYKIELTNKSNYVEVKQSAVRIPVYFGAWTITKTDQGTKVFIEYQTDPGGAVPDWMAQGAAVKNPYDTFESLRNLTK